YLEQLEPGSPAHVIPFGIRLAGPLDTTALVRAVNDVIDRHEPLRTVFAEQDGRRYQRTQPRLRLEPPVVDLTARTASDRVAAVRRHEEEVAASRLDVTTGP